MEFDRFKKTRGYTHHALLPQILVNLTWLIIEVSCISLIILYIDKNIDIVMDKIWVSLIIILLFSIVETFRRLSITTAITYHFYVKIFSSILRTTYKAVLFFKTRRAIFLVYISSNLLFLVIISQSVIKGLETPLRPLAGEYSALMNNAVALSTLTLAIFFAVIVAIVQNVSKEFSGAFLKIVITDSIFISGVLLILLLNFGFFSIMRFGSNEYLMSAAFMAACYILVTFTLLLWLTIYYLSIPNIIRRTTRKTGKIIKKKVPKAPSPINGKVLLAKITKKQKLQSWLARWIIGSVKLKQLFELGVAKREVDREVIEEIEEKLRPQGSALLIAIEKDRHEVVAACLDGFEDAVRIYIEARRNYIGGIDQFNMYVLSQLEGALKLALDSPNQRYTEEISHSAARIGKSTLILKTVTIWGESNDHVGIWTKFLKELALKTVHLKHTEAPMIAAAEIGQIAQILISQKKYNTAVYTVNRDLEFLGEVLTRTNEFFASNVSARCICGMMNQLYTFLFLCSKGEYQDHIYIKGIAGSINTILRNSKEIKSSPENFDAIAAPLVSTLWLGHLSPNIPQLTKRVLSLKYKNTKSEIETTRLFTAAFEILGWVARYTFQIKTTHAGGWVTQSFSESVFYILNYFFEKRNTERYQQEAINNLLTKIVTSTTDAISFAFSNKEINDELDNYSAIPALIIFYAKFRELPQLVDVYKIPINHLIQDFKNIKDEIDPYVHTRKKIRRYIQLFGSWLHLSFPSSELSQTTIEFLRENKFDEDFKKGISQSLVSEMERLGYPHGHLLSEDWYLYPSEHWHIIQHEVNQRLNNRKNYRSYSKLVNS